MTTNPIIAYDGDCQLCCDLGQWLARKLGRRAEVRPATAAEEQEAASELLVIADGKRLRGVAAWQFLLEEFPELTSLNWLATKLHLGRPLAHTLRAAGELSRRFCSGCGGWLRR